MSVRIDVWSDLVCPWCYVGKRRLERALEGFADEVSVQIVHRAFQLYAWAEPGTTYERRGMLMSKYRLSAAEVDALNDRMERLASQEGLEYHLSGGETGNTVDAHRLVILGADRGVQDTVLERFYRAHFTERRSIFSPESLVELAAEAGLDAGETRRVLRDGSYSDRVSADADDARSLGVTGVPFFLIDGRHSVAGAQSTDVFRAALDRARAAVS